MSLFKPTYQIYIIGILDHTMETLLLSLIPRLNFIPLFVKEGELGESDLLLFVGHFNQKIQMALAPYLKDSTKIKILLGDTAISGGVLGESFGLRGKVDGRVVEVAGDPPSLESVVNAFHQLVGSLHER